MLCVFLILLTRTCLGSWLRCCGRNTAVIAPTESYTYGDNIGEKLTITREDIDRAYLREELKEDIFRAPAEAERLVVQDAHDDDDDELASWEDKFNKLIEDAYIRNEANQEDTQMVMQDHIANKWRGLGTFTKSSKFEK